MTFKRRTFSRDQSGLYDADEDTGVRRRTRFTLRRTFKSRIKRLLWAKGICVAVGLYVAWCAAAGAGASSWLWESGGSKSFDSDVSALGRKLAAAIRTPDSRFSLEYLMSMNSGWRNARTKRNSNDADVTAILLDSPSLEQQLKALIHSTAHVQEVWVVLPGEDSPGVRAVEQYRKNSILKGRLHGVRSDLFFSDGDAEFYNEGLVRYQLALQAKTSYIWILDPDVIPGRRFLSLLAHVSTSREVRGMLGGAGGLLPASASRFWSGERADLEGADSQVPWNTSALAAAAAAIIGSSRGGRFDEAAASSLVAAAGTAPVEVGGLDPVHASPLLWPVDLLHSQWFLPRNLIHVLFREKWPMHVYSERDEKDGRCAKGALKTISVEHSGGSRRFVEPCLHIALSLALALSYSLRRYTGLESYVLPSTSSSPEYVADVNLAGGTWGASSGPGSGGVGGNTGMNVAESADLGASGIKKTFRSRGNAGKLPAKVVKHEAGERAGRKLLAERGTGSVERGASRGKARDLTSALSYPGFKGQFQDISAQGARWFWTTAQCPGELVLIVVQGRDQAKLLGPLYRELVKAARWRSRTNDDGKTIGATGSRDVFIALVADGVERRSPGSPMASTVTNFSTGRASVSRVARPECLEIAQALGVSTLLGSGLRGSGNYGLSGDKRPAAASLDRFHMRSVAMLGTSPEDVGSRKLAAAVEFDGSGGGRARDKTRSLSEAGRWRWLAGRSESLHKLETSIKESRGDAEGEVAPEGWRSHHSLSPEEFCLGDAFGVFHVRVGQDFTRAPDQPLHRFLDVFHGLSELLGVLDPTAVAYVDSAPHAGGNARGGTRDVVAEAVEVATRSSGASRPFGLRLPATVDGAVAAKALAYLPEGCLEHWKEPSVVIVVVHPRENSAGSLSKTMLRLRQAHYLGDSVALRIVLHESHVGDVKVDEIVHHDSLWTHGESDVSYFSDQGPDATRLPPAVAALQAFSSPSVHHYSIPLVSGSEPFPQFFSWLKVALVSGRYTPAPARGREDGGASGSSFAGDDREGGSDASSGGRSRRGRKRLTLEDDATGDDDATEDDDDGDNAEDEAGEEGAGVNGDEFLVLSVPLAQGSCPAAGDCSRVWVYDGLAWNAMRERCYRALRGAGVVELGASGPSSAVETACAIGDTAMRLSGFSPKYVSGVGPADDEWENATVWETRSLAAR